MDRPSVRLLLVEDNPGDVRLIREALSEGRWTRFELSHCDTLADALARLREGHIDVMLLDLTLPDSSGLDTLRTAHRQAPDVPILVLTGFDDETVALSAVNEGAQDFLVKGRVDGELIDRAVRYAIERHRVLEQARQLAIIDELTGVTNRRGFLVLFEHHRALADRKGIPLLLLFIDIDNMKTVNDQFGHPEGDRLLIDFARLLTATFRKSDVVARLGGDEFCVLLTEGTDDGAETATSRLLANAQEHSRTVHRPYGMSLSLGVGRYDPAAPCSIEELIERADQAMYLQKQAKKRSA